MKFVFYCAPEAYPSYIFDGSSFYSGVGGSEAALICLARALTSRGHDVVAYTSATSFHCVDGVDYHPAGSFTGVDCDVFVVFRFYAPEVQLARSRVTLLWSHDLPSTDPPYRLELSLAFADAVIAVSAFHMEQLVAFGKAHGFSDLEERIWIGGCGVWSADYTRLLMKIHHRFIYCSVPDRGLRALLEMWPRIREVLPDASLILTGGYQLWGLAADDHDLRNIANQPGVTYLGVIPRANLVSEQLAAEIHLHPCPLPENFCIASMECQAAGTPSIVSSLGALPSTVLDGASGIVVPGNPTSMLFRHHFLQAALSLAQNREKLACMASFARTRACEQFDYSNIAEQWEHNIELLMQSSQRGG